MNFLMINQFGNIGMILESPIGWTNYQVFHLRRSINDISHQIQKIETPKRPFKRFNINTQQEIRHQLHVMN